tara:strand:+ start:3462 stop:3665 length:204 start_codon:yes stop_codon:yes gene_type:complete
MASLLTARSNTTSAKLRANADMNNYLLLFETLSTDSKYDFLSRRQVVHYDQYFPTFLRSYQHGAWQD